MEYEPRYASAQEEPAGQNPPDGAIFNYFLKENAKNAVILEILDNNKQIVRRFSSDDKPYKIPNDNTPPYWIRPQQILSAAAGSHRFTWDLHYAPLDLSPAYPIAATFQQTTPDPTSPWILAGEYVVKLTVNGKTYQQPLSIRMDPRVKTAASDLKKQHDLSLACYKNRLQITSILKEMDGLKTQLKNIVLPKKEHPIGDKIKATETTISALETVKPSGKSLDAAFASIYNILHDTDMSPTTQTVAAAIDTQKAFDEWVKKWADVKGKDVATLNEVLKKLKLKAIGF